MDTSFKSELFRAQVQSIIVPLPTLILGVMVFTPLIFFALVGRVGDQTAVLHIWFGTWMGFAVLRAINYVRMRNKPSFTDRELKVYGGLTLMTMLVAALTWAAVVWTYLEDTDPFRFGVIVVCTAAVSGGIISAYAALFHIVFMFVCIVNLALIIKLFGMGSEDGMFFAFISIIVLVVYVAASYRSSKMFEALVRARLLEQKLVRDLDEKNRIAEEANRTKSEFLASASHDLRQPAHAMSLYLELLECDTPPHMIANIKAKLSASLESLREQLNTILDISRLDANALENQPESFPLQELLDDLDTMFAPRCQEKGLAFEVRPSDAQIHADRVHVGQILINLVGNAIQYTDRGSIRVWAGQVPEGVSIHVEDTGIGIDPEHTEAIFNEFVQLNNPERDKRKGYGLGLSICKRLVELIHGSLTLRSTLGGGSRFRLTVEAASTVAEAPASGPTAPDADPDLTGMMVLLVDDDDDILESMSLHLRKWKPTRLELAQSMAGVRDLLQGGFEPDLVISDYRLRNNENGIDILDHVRASLEREPATFLITGDTTMAAFRGRQGECYKVIHKPLRAGELASIVRDAVDSITTTTGPKTSATQALNIIPAAERSP